MTMEFKEPTISVSITRKINIGNFESIDIFVSLNSLEIGSTDETIQMLLDGVGERMYEAIRQRIVEKTAEIRNRGQAGVATDDEWG